MTLEKISVITFFFVPMPPELSKGNFLNNQHGFRPCSVRFPLSGSNAPDVLGFSCENANVPRRQITLRHNNNFIYLNIK